MEKCLFPYWKPMKIQLCNSQLCFCWRVTKSMFWSSFFDRRLRGSVWGSGQPSTLKTSHNSLLSQNMPRVPKSLYYAILCIRIFLDINRWPRVHGYVSWLCWNLRMPCDGALGQKAGMKFHWYTKTSSLTLTLQWKSYMYQWKHDNHHFQSYIT